MSGIRLTPPDTHSFIPTRMNLVHNMGEEFSDFS